MASAYSDRQTYRPFYTLQPVTTSDTQASYPTSAQSPWSATSQGSTDHLSLTLPLLSPADLAEDPSLYERLQSPSIYLPESSTVMPYSQRHSPAIPPQPDPHTEIYSVPESDPSDIFFNFEGNSQPQSPRPPVTRQSSIVDLTESSPLNMQATSRKRKPNGEGNQNTIKRRRGATPIGSQEAVKTKVEEVDLVEIDDDKKLEEFRMKQQAELIKQQNREKADKPLKLSDFQCVICLDSPTDLTVTHCGHLFCSLCLHEALHAGIQRKTCPVCRQQINISKNKEGKQPKNGVFVLEMKLMTARRKEKQPQSIR